MSSKTQYPLGTVAVYGPTDKLATKMVASVFPTERLELNAIRKWTTDQGDIRENPAIRDELSAFLKNNTSPTLASTKKSPVVRKEEAAINQTAAIALSAQFGQ